MTYEEINLLTTAAEYDEALDECATELRDLRVNETVLAAQTERSTDGAADATAELTAQGAIITALTPVVPTLPAGTRARINTEADLRRATQRHANLTASQAAHGPVTALRRARDLRKVRAEIAEVLVCIQELTANRPTA